MPGRLPRGYGINATTGVVSGVTSETGLASFTVRIRDASGNVIDQPARLTVRAYQQPAIGGELPVFFTVGDIISVALAVTGGQTPYTWSALSVPPGITINASTGLVSGTVAAGTYGSATASVTVVDNLGSRITRQYAYGFEAALVAATPDPFYQPVIGIPYSLTLARTGGHAPFVWTVTSGTLPPGLSISTDNNVTGVPLSAFTGNTTLTVTDAGGSTSTVVIGWAVAAYQTMAIVTSAVKSPVRVTGDPELAGSVSVTGGAGPFVYEVETSATLPGLPTYFTEEVAINSATGALTLESSYELAYSSTFTVTDSTGAAATSSSVTIQSRLPPTLNSFSPGIGSTTTPYSSTGPAYWNVPYSGVAPFTYSALGVTGPAAWALVVSGDGMSITGPAAPVSGVYYLTIQIVDSFADPPNSGTGVITISVL